MPKLSVYYPTVKRDRGSEMENVMLSNARTKYKLNFRFYRSYQVHSLLISSPSCYYDGHKSKFKAL